MAIKIYTNYEEFISNESEIAEYFEDQSLINNYTENDSNDQLDSVDFNDDIEDLRENAKFYVINDPEDEDLAEEISSMLGKYTKNDLNGVRQIVRMIF